MAPLFGVIIPYVFLVQEQEETSSGTQSEAPQLSMGAAERRESSSSVRASTGGVAVSADKTDFAAETVANLSEDRGSQAEEKTHCSTETQYGVYNFKVTVSREMLQRGAAVLSQQMLDIPYTPDVEEIQHEGPLRRMAISMTE